MKKRFRKNPVKQKLTVLFLLLALMLLSGCSSKSYTADKNTIFPQKKGTITQVLVSDFDKDYYDINELTQYIKNEVNDFQQIRGEESVKLISCEKKDQVAKVQLLFNSYKDYSLFNEQDLFFGTLAEAEEAGYSFDTEFYLIEDAKKKEPAAASEILENEKYHVLIIDHPTNIELPKKLNYLGGAAAVIQSEKKIEITDNVRNGENLVYLIYK